MPVRSLLAHPNATRSYTVHDDKIIGKFTTRSNLGRDREFTIYEPNYKNMYWKEGYGKVSSWPYYIAVVEKSNSASERDMHYAIKVEFFMNYDSTTGEISRIYLQSDQQLNGPKERSFFYEEERLKNYPLLLEVMHKHLSDWANKWSFTEEFAKPV